MSLGLLLVAGLAAEPPRILDVRVESRSSRSAVVVLSTAPLAEVAAKRNSELSLSFQAGMSAGVPNPAAFPPIESIRIEREPGRVTLRIRVGREVPYEVQRDGTLLTILFGRPADGPAERPVSPDVKELYERLFPAAGQEVKPADAAEEPREGREGFGLGLLSLRPSVDAIYVDAESTFLETPEPVRDRYYEVRPRIGWEVPLATGRLTGDYEAHIRRGSAFGVVRSTTHLVNLALEVPIGPSLRVQASDHFAHGTLETAEVDPGREYFFQLGRFTRNDVAFGLSVETSGRLDVIAGARLNNVTVEEGTGFFGYQNRLATLGLGYEVTPNLRAKLAYSYDWIPRPAERPEVESRAHSVGLTLEGEVLPLLKADVFAGYRDQRSPRAGQGGQGFTGLTFGARILRELGQASTFSLSASRSLHASAFEDNAFYVATSGWADLTLPLPLSVSFRGGAGYHWNEYRTVASELDKPREDRIFGWSVGLGRPVTSWSYVRADYRRERRDSNIDRMDSETEAFTVQVGLGLFRRAEPR